MRKFFVVLAVVTMAAVGLAVAGPASAVDDLVIQAGGFTIGDPGTIVEVANVEVPADLVGQTCLATLHIQNNGSIHPENDLIVTTAGESFVFENYEKTAGQSTLGSGEIEMGENVLVELKFGTTGRTSGEFVITFDCEEPPPETTTTTVAPEITVPETTVPVTTTIPTDVAPQTTVAPTTTVAPAQPEQPTAAQPNYTG